MVGQCRWFGLYGSYGTAPSCRTPLTAQPTSQPPQTLPTCLDMTVNVAAVLDIGLDVAKAMIHLHRHNVLHSDIKVRLVRRHVGRRGGFFIYQLP